MPGTLFIVATPLGNLEDLSPRARRVLTAADAVLAEDTRRAGLLCQRLGIEAKRFLSFHDHNETGRLPQAMSLLEAGQTLALVSDAGTPLLSDPGFRLVRAAREAGHAVVPVPGPSAPVAALSACGLPPQPFVFLGFLPRKPGEVKKTLEPYANLPASIVFFERKDRLAASLALAREILGERECCLARELTKEHEEFILGSLSSLAAAERELLGELTVVLGPPLAGARAAQAEVREALAAESAAGGRPKDVARRVAARCPGWTAKEIYELLAKDDPHAP